jgi:hypothetical protein
MDRRKTGQGRESGVMTMFFLLAALAAAAQPPEGEGFGRAHFRGSLFLSPMGEPFRSDDPAADNIGTWFTGVDADRDGALTVAEMEADAGRFFATLDTDRDGELGPEEVAAYETNIAPEVQLGMQMRARFGGAGGGRRGGHRHGGGWGGRQGEGGGGGRRPGRGEYDEGLEGGGRFAFLNIPEPVISADADFNRGVSRAEFLRAAGQRFLMLDTDKNGRLTRAELPALPERHGGKRKGKKPPPREREGTPLPED